MTCTRNPCGCRGHHPVHPITKAGRDWTQSWWTIGAATLAAAVVIVMTWNGSLFG